MTRRGLALQLMAILFLVGYGPRLSISQETREEDLLLREYRPKSMLKVDASPVLRAKFPFIDFHGHLRRATPERSIAVMDACNMKVIVDFDGFYGEHFRKQKEKFSEHPGRFIHFARINWRTIDDPDFSGKAARQLEEDVKAGARGLKISKALGLYVRTRDGKLLAVNDRRLDAVWAKCGELGIPVAIHVADPDSFFLKIDRFNENYEQLMRNPKWSFYGKDFPPKDAILKQRNEIIERHPKTIFVGLHVANRPENLAEVAGWLDKYPNLYVEFGARLNQLGRQPYTARKFFLKYPDRILFGVDWSPPNLGQYRRYLRFLETYDEYFEYAGRPGSGRWRIYGIGLPDDILKKVYYGNAAKLLKLNE